MLIRKTTALAATLLLTLTTLGTTSAQAEEAATGELTRVTYDRKGSVIVGQNYELAHITASTVTVKTYGCKGELLWSDGFHVPESAEDFEMTIGVQTRFGAQRSEIHFKKPGHSPTTIETIFPKPAKCTSSGEEVKPVVNTPRGKAYLKLKRSHGKIVKQAYEIQRVRASFIAVKTYDCKGKRISWVGSRIRKGKNTRLFLVRTPRGAHHSKIVLRTKGAKPLVKRVNFPTPHRCN